MVKTFSQGATLVHSKRPHEEVNQEVKKALNKFELKDINKIYINRGPGSFAGIRNSISVVKALKLAKNIDYYCYSLEDFKGEKDVKYENVPYLCDKFKIKKNLINPIYIS